LTASDGGAESVDSFARLALLDEARDKVRRGKEHFYVLDMQLQTFWESNPYPIVHEYDAKQSKNLFRLKMQRPAPLRDWALIIGDAVHNARSALDYIAWRLAGSVIGDTSTSFPICTCAENIDKAQKSRLKNVLPDAVTAIRGFQPYLRPNLKESALWLLEELDRRDKHRLLTPIQCLASTSKVVFRDPLPCTVPMKFGSRLEDNAVIVEVGGAPNPNVDMDLELALDILLERGIASETDDYEVRECLVKIFEAVDQVIARFNWLLTRNPSLIRKV
jgi:hypothetical protein